MSDRMTERVLDILADCGEDVAYCVRAARQDLTRIHLAAYESLFGLPGCREDGATPPARWPGPRPAPKGASSRDSTAARDIEDSPLPGDGAPDNGEPPPVGPDPAVAAGMDGTTAAVDNTAAPDGQEHESAQEHSAPPAPADGPGTPADAAAEITQTRGDTPGGTATTPEAPQAKRYFPFPAPEPGLADELTVAAGVVGGFGECRSCHGHRGLPVHADNRKTKVTGDMRVCAACLPGMRGEHPDVVFSFGHLQPVKAEAAALKEANRRLQVTIGELKETIRQLEAGKPAHDEWASA